MCLWCSQHDQQVWRGRPLAEKLLDGAVKNVRHLRRLRLVMMDFLLQRFTLGVDVYLSYIRDNAFITDPQVRAQRVHAVWSDVWHVRGSSNTRLF